MPGQVRGDEMMAVTELPGASANATVALTLPDPDDAAVEGSGLTDSYKAIFN